MDSKLLLLEDKRPSVNVGLVYNAFDPTKVVKESLLFQDGNTLANYLEGLPDTCEWKVGYNGIPVEAADYSEIVPEANSHITIVAVPRGGGAKDILRMVALLAVVIVAAFLFAPLLPGGLALAGTGFGAYAAMAAFTVLGSYLVNMALPPSMLKMKSSEEESQSYGYDGAKNTSREGLPIPVVYGQHWVAGNYVDMFTQMSGQDQYLYGRCVLSDGEIEGLQSAPYVNDLPITDYRNIEYGHTKGLLTEVENRKFNRTVAQYARQAKLRTSIYDEYTTTGDIDAFELNFVLPMGLIEYHNDGDTSPLSTGVNIQYALYGTTNWTASGEITGADANWTLYTDSASPVTTHFRLKTKASTITNTTNNSSTYAIQYRLVGAPSWTTYITVTDTATAYVQPVYTTNAEYGGYGGRGVVAIDIDDPLAGGGTIGTFGFPVRTTDLVLPSGSYEFQIPTANAAITQKFFQRELAPGTATPGGPVSNTTVTWTEESKTTIRKTYKSPNLPRGRYHIRVKQSTKVVIDEERHMDDVYWTDVSEVQNSNVALNSTATGWYVIKMTDQLSGIPNIIWNIKGVKVDIYDKNGTVTSTAWSDNPADIVLDMLISERRGALRDKITIDFPAYVKWREHCAAEGLKFNGTFDEMTNLWDALQSVYRVGRAAPVRMGSKLSVMVDKPAEPTMLFGPGNIFKESFKISYLPLTERANEYEVSYYDKTDYNKKKTVRIADSTIAQAGQVPKTAQYELFGVDNFTQAQKEIWYQLYNNRLAKRAISFDAPIESIGLGIGDVAYIQHDLVDWGTGGRLAAVTSTTNLTLDKPVVIESGKTYALLLIQDKLQKATGTLGTRTAYTYPVTGLSSTANAVSTLKRISTDTGDEAEVLDFVYTGGSTGSVTLDRIVTGTSVTFWDVDVIEERTVSTGVGTHTTLTVSSAFSSLPNKYANYMFGVSSTVKRPYRLRGISGEGFDRRTLTFGEYNELVYSAPETTIPAPAAALSPRPNHVANLQFMTDARRLSETIRGTLSWTTGDILRYGGADIYIARGSSGFVFFNSVVNTNEVMIDVQQGETLTFRVVAFDDRMIRAATNTAPEFTYVVRTSVAPLTSPGPITGVVDSYGKFANVTLTIANPSTDPSLLTAPASPHRRAQIKFAGTSVWIDQGVNSTGKFSFGDVPAGTHDIRGRAEIADSALSDWVTNTLVVAVPTLTTPTIASDGTAVDHTVNADGSVDVSLDWSWSGTEADIDGFEIVTYASTSSSAYTIGTTVSAENVTLLSPNKRAIIFKGIPATQYYTFYVRAYKNMHSSFAANGRLYSTAVKPSLAAENPYRPESQTAFTGDIVGTINVSNINQWSAITGTGKPSDNAGTIGSLTLVSGSPTMTIAGNTVTKTAGGDGYNAAVIGEGLSGSAIIRGTPLTFNGGWVTAFGLDDTAAGYTSATVRFIAAFTADYGSGHSMSIYENNVQVASSGFFGATSGQAVAMAYDGKEILAIYDGVVRCRWATTEGLNLFPKIIPYHQGNGFKNIRYGTYTQNNFSAIGGEGVPSPYAGTTLPILTKTGAGTGTQVGNTFTKTSADAWNLSFSTTHSYYGSGYARCKLNGTTQYAMFGLFDGSIPTDANNSTTSTDFGFYIIQTGNELRSFVNGVHTIEGWTWANGDTLEVSYDGVNARLFKNGTLLKTISATSERSLRLAFTPYGINSSISDVQFMPAPDNAWATIGGTGKPQDNATKNVITRSATAPTSPTDGDVWVDTSTTPNVIKIRNAGAWEISANYVTQGTHIGVDNGATKNTVTYSGTEPASPTNGDIWVETDVTPVVTRVRISDAWQVSANYTTQGTDIGVENGADVTSVIDGLKEININYDYTSTILTNELPRDVSYKLMKNGSAISSSVTWSVTTIVGSITASISGSGTGVLSITAFNSASATLRIQAVYSGTTRTFDVTVTKVIGPSPTGGTGGSGNPGTTGTDTTIANSTASTYSGVQGGPITVKAGTAGTVTLTAPLTFQRTSNTTGYTTTYGKWQWRTVGGSWADVATEITNTVQAYKNTADPSLSELGEISVAMSKTSLTSGTDYEFQLLLRCSTTLTVAYAGTATAAGS